MTALSGAAGTGRQTSLGRYTSSVDEAAGARPVGVKEFPARPVNALAGVGTEIVTLRLQQIVTDSLPLR
jgi:hypothetical protein